MEKITVEQMKELVFSAIGEASMCWDPIPSGVFNSTRAKEVGERLIAALAKASQIAEPMARQEATVTGYGDIPTPSQEPLAVLADRKDCWICEISGPGLDPNASWCIEVAPGPHCWWAKTYPEAESKARAYLTGLPDKEDGK